MAVGPLLQFWSTMHLQKAGPLRDHVGQLKQYYWLPLRDHVGQLK